MDNKGFGGKAQSLIRIEQLVRVPSFCIIPTDVFDIFVTKTRIRKTLQKLVDSGDFPGAKKLVLTTPMPDDVAARIRKISETIPYELVSVRSSAVNEDGQKKSFAGQYDSFLFVHKEDIPATVQKCWASLFNTNVLKYHEGEFCITGMAVVVQQMIDAARSGIAFSVDPTGNTDASLIECAEGVGENIVSGIITPCRYYVFEDGTIQGENRLLSEEEIHTIMNGLRKIVDSFECEIDSEWCIDSNGTVFFLQARPITAVAQSKKPYVSYLSRPFSLMRVQLYYLGEYEGIKRITDGHYYLNPLFIQEDGEVHVYYNNISQKENPPNIFSYLGRNVDFESLYKNAENAVQHILSVVVDKARCAWQELVEDMITLYPFSTLGNIAGRSDDVPQTVKYWFGKYREQYDKVIWMAEDYLCETAANALPDDEAQYVDYLFLEEAFGSRPVPKESLESRKKGYLYFNGELLVKEDENTFNRFLNKSDICLKDFLAQPAEQNVIRGTSAYGGRIEGIVRIIRKLADLTSFKKGEIIVSPMTVPQYAEIMKDSIGIITDEGGVLCHAAIVARELAIPCVIGTKNATALLHNGDRVRINGDDGTVEIL